MLMAYWDDSAVRKQRLRAKRREAGWLDYLIWLYPDGQDALTALRRPGETLDACVNRALVTLHRLLETGTSPVPSPAPKSMNDAALLARLQQAEHETPRPTYAAIAAELGLPAGTVSRKAAAWIKAGALQPRPLGGARPRRRRDAPP
jgi:hypothetical protein